MSHVSRLHHRLNEMNARILGVTLGTNPNVTAEQVAEEINKALDQIESGKFEEVIID
jgi:hypothetical protein